MRSFFQKPFFKSIVFAAISILLIVGVCYAAVQNFSGNKLVNVGGMTFGNASEWPANQIEFEQTPSVIGFHSGADEILMRGGNDRLCLGWGDDELYFNLGNGALTFGHDWSTGASTKAALEYTEASQHLKLLSTQTAEVCAQSSVTVRSQGIGNVVMKSEGGDVIVDLGS